MLAELAPGMLTPLAFGFKELDWVAPLKSVASEADAQALAMVTGIPNFQGL